MLRAEEQLDKLYKAINPISSIRFCYVICSDANHPDSDFNMGGRQFLNQKFPFLERIDVLPGKFPENMQNIEENSLVCFMGCNNLHHIFNIKDFIIHEIDEAYLKRLEPRVLDSLKALKNKWFFFLESLGYGSSQYRVRTLQEMSTHLTPSQTNMKNDFQKTLDFAKTQTRQILEQHLESTVFGNMTFYTPKQSRKRRVDMGLSGETRRQVHEYEPQSEYPPGSIGEMMQEQQQKKSLPPLGRHGERAHHNQRASSTIASSSSTPVFKAYNCPVLGNHIITFVTPSSRRTTMFYKSHGKRQEAGSEVFDLFHNVWLEAKGFSRVSSSGTRTLQKYSWSDDFLLNSDFRQNKIFFNTSVSFVTGCTFNDADSALEDFCALYSNKLEKNKILEILLKTMCKSNKSRESWRIAVELSNASKEKPSFYDTRLGGLFWRLGGPKKYDISVEDRFGYLLSKETGSLDNVHLLLRTELLINKEQNFVNNVLT